MRIKEQSIILYLLVVTLLISLLLLSGCSTETSTVQPQSAITVNYATAGKRDIYGSSSYSGRLKASSEVEVIPKTSERIISINVKEGQTVKAGQTLITLDDSSLKASIMKAEAQLASAQANQTNNNISLEAARKNYERTKSLFDQGAVAQTELETAQDTYDSLKSGTVEASLATAQAALLDVQDQLSYCSVAAPVSGIVGRLDVSVGDHVTTARTVAVIDDPREMKIEVMVGESELSKIQLNSKVNVTIKSAGKNAFNGTVTSIASVLDANSEMYPITVTIDNSEGEIKSGMYAEVNIDTSTVKNALCIPLSAIIPSDGVNIVYTINAKNKAVRVEVKTGINDETYVQILSGLKAGDKVVTLGNTLISDGSPLITKNKEGK